MAGLAKPCPISPEREAEIKQAIEREEESIRLKKGVELWAMSGVGKLHHENGGTLPLLKHEGFKRALGKTLTLVDDGGIIVMMGDRGTGKTQCAVEVLRDWCFTRQRFGRYIRAREIGMTLRNCFTTGESELAAFRRLAFAGLLVIDEFQERGGTEWDDKQITTLIDTRYANRKPTIIICNMTPEAFKESAGPSIVDRIHECGGVINFNWPSFRRIK